MKSSILGIAGLSIIGGAMLAISQISVSGISNTKHNLGAGSGGNEFSGTTEICVFCHTPHGADTSASVPLWNRNLEASPQTAYTTYDDLGTTSLDGATAVVGSVSIACLSCHDGQQAMNTMRNEPGSGTGTMTGTWSGTAQTGGILNDTSGKGFPNLGTDLRNDHPVGIQYGGGGVDSTTHSADGVFGGALKDPDFVKPTRETTGGGKLLWYVDSNTDGIRTKDEIQLYTRVDAPKSTGVGTISGTQPFVECASCHDPHVDNGTTFLRRSNDNSAVCLACHDK